MTTMPFSNTSILAMVVFLVLFAIPAGIVLKRTGHSPWWALLCLVPIAAMVGLWVLAFARWTPQRSA